MKNKKGEKKQNLSLFCNSRFLLGWGVRRLQVMAQVFGVPAAKVEDLG